MESLLSSSDKEVNPFVDDFVSWYIQNILENNDVCELSRFYLQSLLTRTFRLYFEHRFKETPLSTLLQSVVHSFNLSPGSVAEIVESWNCMEHQPLLSLLLFSLLWTGSKEETNILQLAIKLVFEEYNALLLYDLVDAAEEISETETGICVHLQRGWIRCEGFVHCVLQFSSRTRYSNLDFLLLLSSVEL